MKDDFENDFFMNYWVEVNKIDKKLFFYLSFLKEIDFQDIYVKEICLVFVRQYILLIRMQFCFYGGN